MMDTNENRVMRSYDDELHDCNGRRVTLLTVAASWLMDMVENDGTRCGAEKSWNSLDSDLLSKAHAPVSKCQLGGSSNRLMAARRIDQTNVLPPPWITAQRTPCLSLRAKQEGYGSFQLV
jgi:hypothetical protein